MKKRRRKRQVGLEAEIRLKAREIYESGMAEAMRAAALMIVARKQDEILAILRGAGLQGAAQLVMPTYNQPAVVQSPKVEHPCKHCGREGVKRTKPNRFDPAGSWYCISHVPLASAQEVEDRVDNAILGPPPAAPKKPVLVQTHAPAVMRKSEETPAEPDALTSAMEDAEVVQ